MKIEPDNISEKAIELTDFPGEDLPASGDELNSEEQKQLHRRQRADKIAQLKQSDPSLHVERIKPEKLEDFQKEFKEKSDRSVIPVPKTPSEKKVDKKSRNNRRGFLSVL